MEAVKIDIHISDLLFKYDCVIVPELGGFVSNYASAKINDIHHKFSPPSKQISFNKNLNINDGLLINRLTQRETISYQSASELVQAFVSKSWDGLRKGDKIKIEKVGILFLDGENNIQFQAEESNSFLAESFGLNEFRALPIKREEKSDLKVVSEIVNESKTTKVVTMRKPLYWSAAAVLIISLGSALWVNKSSLEYQEIASYFPTFNKMEVNKYAERQSRISMTSFLEEAALFKESEEFVIDEEGRLKLEKEEPSRLFSKEAVASRKKIDNTKVTVNSFNKGLRYHVMAGCFSNLSNAKKLTSNLQKQGFRALFLGKYKNLNAVSYQSFASREEAIKLLAEVRNHHNGSAWLLEATF